MGGIKISFMDCLQQSMTGKSQWWVYVKAMSIIPHNNLK
jgi:hypothetical protein